MIIFNEVQTLGYATSFNYIGETTNINRTSKITLRGAMQSNSVFEYDGQQFSGLAYVSSSGTWLPLGGGDPLITGSAPSLYGNMSFEGGAFYLSFPFGSGDSLEYFHNLSPLYDIWSEMDSIRSQFLDFQDIVLNNVSIGSGRVTNLYFPQNLDARKGEYTVELEVYHTGNHYNITGEGYNLFLTNFAPFVQNIQEEFTFSDNLYGDTDYSRSLSFDAINPNLTGINFDTEIKLFASGLMFNDPLFNASIKTLPAFYQQEGVRIFNESYDHINGSYSFNEEFRGPSSGLNYRHEYSTVVSLTKDKNTISENGKIIGVREPALNYIKSGLTHIKSTAQSRLFDVYSSYLPSCSDSLYLTNSKQIINEAAKQIDYSLEYSNNPFSSGCFLVSRQNQITKSEDGKYTVSEQGVVKNTCYVPKEDRMEQCINYFNNNIKDDILGRSFELYSSISDGCGCDGPPETSDLVLIIEEKDYSIYNGEFGYTFTYKNQCEELINGCFRVYLSKTTNDSIHNVFLGVTPYDGEIAQKQNTSSLINEQQTILVKSQCSGKIVSDYLNVAVDSIDIPTVSPYYLNGANYEFQPDESQLTLSVTYNYTGSRAYSNYNV